jgi:hypothetical protein
MIHVIWSFEEHGVASDPILKFRWRLLQLGTLLLIAAGHASPQHPPAVQQLIDELAPCSVLRAELDRGAYGRGVDQPYMVRMRERGVKRALLELDGVIHGTRVENVRVARQLYFRHFDGPDSQISDEATLQAIETNGLSGQLESLARSRMLAAPFVSGEFRLFAGNQVFSFVEFFASPWLREQNVVVLRSVKPKPRIRSILDGDAAGTKALLKSHEFTTKDLNLELFDSAMSRYDNTDVIKLLLTAGAQVNARTKDGTTPLMIAVSHPCNIRPLLNGGADPNARDKWGRSALRLAREAKDTTAIRLLEEAGAKW